MRMSLFVQPKIDLPHHSDTVSEYWDEFGRDMGHSRVSIGKENLANPQSEF